MIEEEIVAALNEVRLCQGITLQELAGRLKRGEGEVAAFFEKGSPKDENFARAAATALGLRTERFKTCAGAIIDYYKSGMYFASEEMQMIFLYRAMPAQAQARLVALLAAIGGAAR